MSSPTARRRMRPPPHDRVVVRERSQHRSSTHKKGCMILMLARYHAIVRASVVKHKRGALSGPVSRNAYDVKATIYKKAKNATQWP